MTHDLKQHYLKGGIFTAIFSPKITDDLDMPIFGEHINKRVRIHQNTKIVPAMEDCYAPYIGQFRFSIKGIPGWSPECDFRDITPIEEFIKFPETLPRHLYKIVIPDKHAGIKLFGRGVPLSYPYTTGRDFPSSRDEYVLSKLTENISSIKVYKTLWQGEELDEIVWEKLR